MRRAQTQSSERGDRVRLIGERQQYDRVPDGLIGIVAGLELSRGCVFAFFRALDREAEQPASVRDGDQHSLRGQEAKRIPVGPARILLQCAVEELAGVAVNFAEPFPQARGRVHRFVRKPDRCDLLAGLVSDQLLVLGELRSGEAFDAALTDNHFVDPPLLYNRLKRIDASKQALDELSNHGVADRGGEG